MLAVARVLMRANVSFSQHFRVIKRQDPVIADHLLEFPVGEFNARSEASNQYSDRAARLLETGTL